MASTAGIADGYGTGSMYLNVTASRSGSTITVNWNVSASWTANNYRTANGLSITIYGTNRYSGTINIWGDGSTYNTNNNPSGSFTISNSSAVTINFSMSCNWLGANTSGTRSVSSSISVSASSFTVTLNPNGGSFTSSKNSTSQSSAQTYTVDAGSSITNVKGTRTNYNCTGWYTAASGGTKILANNGSLLNIGQNWTLYAQWASSLATTTVTLDADGGFWGNGESSYNTTMTQTTTSCGVAEAPHKPGYKCLGMFTDTGEEVYHMSYDEDGGCNIVSSPSTYWTDNNVAWTSSHGKTFLLGTWKVDVSAVTFYAHWEKLPDSSTYSAIAGWDPFLAWIKVPTT